MACACFRRGVVAVFLLATCLSAAPVPGSEPPARRTGWAELSAVAPGTSVVVVLDDSRRLHRFVVGTTGDSLITVDLSAVASGDRREQVLALVRNSPQRYLAMSYLEQDGTRIPIVERFDRASIVTVARPKPLVFTVPAPLSWLLSHSGPCPNCDAAQTWPSGETPLPSPRPRRAAVDPLMGAVLYQAPTGLALNPIDGASWEQLRPLLPASLRGR